MQINEGRFTKNQQTTGGVVRTHLNKCWSNWKSSPSKGGHKTYSKQNHHPHYINFLFDCCHTQGDIHGMFILVDFYRLLMPLALLYNTNTQVLNMQSKFQAPSVIPLKGIRFFQAPASMKKPLGSAPRDWEVMLNSRRWLLTCNFLTVSCASFGQRCQSQMGRSLGICVASIRSRKERLLLW